MLIIGGGVVGAGAALDAVTRGLSTAIVEARDWASGTSSRSSKLIHGGLRYLEMLDFGLVREALHERGLLVQRIAPHLIRPVPFLYPLAHRVWERPYVGAGVLLYDTLGTALGTSRGLPHHRHLSRRRALREAPCLSPDAVTGAVQYWDAQVDDARHTLAVVRTAVSFGAQAANRTRVIGLLRVGERVTGARVIDLETGTEFEIRAKQVINATGVWTDETQQLADTRGQFHVRASKGVHLVVPRDRLQSSTGIILRTETSVLLVIPWGRHWIIGTTDTDWNLDLAHPAASARDIDYLLDRVNSVLSSPLTRADVEGVYAGLRPLLSGESESTSKLSREHVVGHPVPGLVVIAGGKYTTYRVMGRDAVDEAVRGMDARVPAILHRVDAAGRRRGLGGGAQPAAPAGGRVRPARGPDRSPARPLRQPDPRAAGIDRRASRSWLSRCRASMTTCRPRWCTRSATRAPGTWTTCWLDGPGPRSRPGTGECLPRRWWPSCWLRCWAGTTASGPTRSSTTWPGWPPSASHRSSRMTRPPTPPGSARPTSSRSADFLREWAVARRVGG